MKSYQCGNQIPSFFCDFTIVCSSVAFVAFKQILCHFLDESQEVYILPSLPSFINHDRSLFPLLLSHHTRRVSKMFKKLKEDFWQSNDDTVGNIK